MMMMTKYDDGDVDYDDGDDKSGRKMFWWSQVITVSTQSRFNRPPVKNLPQSLMLMLMVVMMIICYDEGDDDDYDDKNILMSKTSRNVFSSLVWPS